MKKNLAFTMSEALIVLGIVAVLATLSVIAVTNAKPDENIIMFRRAYATTLKTIQNLMNDSALYPNANNSVAMKLEDNLDYSLQTITAAVSSLMLQEEWCDQDLDPDCGTLATPITSFTSGGFPTTSKTITPGTSFTYQTSIKPAISYLTTGSGTTSGDGGAGTSDNTGFSSGGKGNSSDYEFSTLATSVFGKGFTDTTITGDMKTNYPYLAASNASASNKFALSFMSRLNPLENTVSGSTVKFTTPDGFYWEITDNFNNATTPNAIITVHIDGNPNASGGTPSCYYNSETCPAPNKFTFYVEQSGKVHHKLATTGSGAANDPMACSYARYPSITKNSKINKTSNNTCFN